MAFKQWLNGVLVGQAKNDPNQAFIFSTPPAASAEEEEVAGLNFRKAIEVHQKWKTHLQTVINSDKADSLSVEEVSQDDRCVLGKWIHGVGGQKFGQESLFKTLQADHAHFHVCAGMALQSALRGNKSEAQTALKTGDFAHASQAVVMDLAKMYTTITG